MGGAGAQGALVVTNKKMKVTTMKGGGVGGEDAVKLQLGSAWRRDYIYTIYNNKYNTI